MSKKVLLVEDAKEMQIMVNSILKDDCNLKSVETVRDAKSALDSNDYDLIILDVVLPDGDGFEFCQELRATRKFQDVPIIFLTGEVEVDSRVLGFELGGNDYVTKPIEPKEFRARVVANLRRSVKVSNRYNGFRVDIDNQKVFEIGADGKERPLNLTPIEFKLLTHFLRNADKVISRTELLTMFWGDQVHVSSHTVDTHISSLRKKISCPGVNLKSIFKKGYRLSYEKQEPEKDN